jgi:hypothetical protein
MRILVVKKVLQHNPSDSDRIADIAEGPSCARSRPLNAFRNTWNAESQPHLASRVPASSEIA